MNELTYSRLFFEGNIISDIMFSQTIAIEATFFVLQEVDSIFVTYYRRIVNHAVAPK